MREKIDMAQFAVQSDTMNEADSLATKVEKLAARGKSAEEITDKLYLGRDLYTGKATRDAHWQRLNKEVRAIVEAIESDR